MVSPFINSTFNLDSPLDGQAFDEVELVQLSSNASAQEVDWVIQAVYRQVLGNVHVMDSQRLVAAESQLRQGGVTVREFVRQVAKSELYRDLFVTPCSATRTIELNFKHLLGRSPGGYEELALHGQIYEQGGFEAEIDSYLDSEEYQSAYGEDVVPYYRGYTTQAGGTLAAFADQFPRVQGFASSDKEARQIGSRLSQLSQDQVPEFMVLLVSSPSTSTPSPRPSSDSYVVNPGQSAPSLHKFEPSALLGVNALKDDEPRQLWPGASGLEIDEVIQSVYRQVLGNVHVMESERLVSAEAQLRNGELSVREFVRQVALSPLYARLFVEPCSRTRTIELNFKHLLGRAPETYEEMARQGQIYDQGGFAGEIDSYLESEEYLNAYGEMVVPYARGYDTQTGQAITAFTHWFQLSRGAASSDRGLVPQNRSQLNRFVMGNAPSLVAPVTGTFTPLPLNSSDLKPRVEVPLPEVALESLPLTTDRERYSQFYSGYQAFKDTDPLALRVGFSDADAEVVIRALYRQVLGNAHVMESERLITLESQLKGEEISVREFVRQLAKSELYRSRFFENCYWYRAIELNFKHLLGRAPDNFDEMRYHSAVLDQGDYDAEIDSYLDSDEYQDNFGDWVVPYYRGTQTQLGQSMVGFTNMFQLLKSASSSDKDLATNQEARLIRSVINGSPFGKLQPSSEPVSLIRETLNLESSSTSGALDPVSLIRAALASDGVKGSTVSASDQELQKTIDGQAKELEQLQAQLADLQRSASLGESITNHIQFNGISSRGDGVEVVNEDSLQQTVEAQQRQIESLKQQIMQSRTLSAVGEARLNQWRSRIFA